MKRLLLSLGLACAMPMAAHAAAHANGEKITVKGEMIDTWCYYSGVMGGPEAVVGSAHHTCALWCSAGGIPVGLLAEDGEVYMVLTIEGDDGNSSGDTQLSLAAHTITADGVFYERDGLKYIVVEKVVTDHGITNLNHEDFGPVPGFAIPKSARGG